MDEYVWQKVEKILSRKYTCGYCGNQIASERGWIFQNPRNADIKASIHICHFCSKPTFLDLGGKQYPGASYGEPVENIDDISVQKLYDEARRTMSVSSYTAAVLACRKLLMHIAVQKGAKEGNSFTGYVEFLAEHHYIPPDAIGWVDHIRSKGNEANHEIKIMGREDAETLLSFISILLKVIYEFPAKIKPKTEQQVNPAA